MIRPISMLVNIVRARFFGKVVATGGLDASCGAKPHRELSNLADHSFHQVLLVSRWATRRVAIKKMLLLLALLVGGVVVLRRLLSTHFSERLSGLHERMMGRMMDHMPEN